jgi:preprotein translocase subunit SecG
LLSILLLETQHPGGNISWMMWVAFGFFGLMVLIGWLTSRKKTDAGDQVEEHPNQTGHH